MLRVLLGACLTLGLVPVAEAQGCFRRDYSEAHLAQNPNQTVEMLEVLFLTDGDLVAEVRARLRDGPETFRNTLYCWEPEDQPAAPGTWICGVECDGGTFSTRLNGEDSILLKTGGGFLVSGACSEPGDTEDTRWVRDEGAPRTVFKLYRTGRITCPN